MHIGFGSQISSVYPNGPNAVIISRTFVLDPSERRMRVLELGFFPLVMSFLLTLLGLICKYMRKCLMNNASNPIRIDSPARDEAVHHESVREGHESDRHAGCVQIRTDLTGELSCLQQ